MMTESLNYDNSEPSSLITMMEQVVPEVVRTKFADYVRSFDCRTWHILSDYCIGANGYPNDVMVFTVFPEHDHEKFLESAKTCLPTDLKKRSMIPPESIGFLKHPAFFTFAFAIDKKPRFLKTVEMARIVISEHLENLNNGEHTESSTNQTLLKKFKQLREHAKSRNFNLSLFNRIYLSVIFASFITLMIARNTRLEILYWVGDRDSIHSSWDNFCYWFFHGMSFSWMSDEALPWVKSRFPSLSGEELEATFDPYTRVPDHFAGPLAHLDLESLVIRAKSPTYAAILDRVIVGNPHFSFASLTFKPEQNWLKTIELREGPPP